MNNPKVTAAMGAVASLYLGYRLFGPTDEAPSPTLYALQWVLFIAALIGLVGGLYQMSKGK
ncbi:MAG: hypothetical protein H6883_04185 [Rhodobiaceae bacterium]|nr:hypothetical protein [Rhodobiaceae bacterium]